MPFSYAPPSGSASYQVLLEGDQAQVVSNAGETLTFIVDRGQKNTVLSLVDVSRITDRSLTPLIALEHLFGQSAALQEIIIHDPKRVTAWALGDFFLETDQLAVNRAEFFQLPYLWRARAGTASLTERWTVTNDRKHPLRIQPQDGIGYRRFVPSIGKTLQFRRAETERDLVVFHEWHNQPRVSEFWELNQSPEELREYLLKQRNDRHQSPWIVEADGAPVAYFEFYWTPEDRLAPYYDYEPFDRGFHFLIGEKSFLGVQNTDAIIKSALHFLFIDDPRTRRVMAEPRHDNAKVLKYVELIPAWKKLKEFDFPHKRAALLECARERFLDGNFL